MESLLTVLAGMVGILLLAGGVVLGWYWRQRRQRRLREDALKQVYGAKLEGRSLTVAELAGRLGRSRSATLRLARDLETSGLVCSQADALQPTAEGERLGRDVLRGHRLWETYLAQEARRPVASLHSDAERAEHRLTPAGVEALADHLGHPPFDPHGDPIPTAAGEHERRSRLPLTDWPRERLAVVVHIEDEPPQALAAALRANLRPGTVLRVVDRNADAIVCETVAGRCALPPAFAAHIDVRAAADDEGLSAPPLTLAGLALGAEAEVAGLSVRCTGLGRRRLLDLGFTAGTPVKALLTNVGGAAHAYRIRGTTIALRKEQAEQVLIRPPAASTSPSEAERRS
jgi:DtxR family Mn-dependent transcriptional regulator